MTKVEEERDLCMTSRFQSQLARHLDSLISAVEEGEKEKIREWLLDPDNKDINEDRITSTYTYRTINVQWVLDFMSGQIEYVPASTFKSMRLK